MKILVITDYYLPGYKGGGPIRTIANMVERLGDDFQFFILTADRDLGDTQPYADVKTGEWVRVGKAQVRYLSPDEMQRTHWRQLLGAIAYDVLYLNSFFSSLSVKTLFLRWRGQIPHKPVILAPRGEFYDGALALKSLKKRVYLLATKPLGMYKNIHWQASTEDETGTITRLFPKAQVHVARDLIALPDIVGDRAKHVSPLQTNDLLKIVFISRISPKKNLDYALRVLAEVKSSLQFDIYGPKEDPDYWARCQALMVALPPHITATYRGELPPDKILQTFAQYHLFFFPTRGENFGHVIWEALNAGCLVLTSDQTPWTELAQHQVGWALPLDNPAGFVMTIEAIKGDQDWQTHRQNAHGYAQHIANDPVILEANRRLFLNAVEPEA